MHAVDIAYVEVGRELTGSAFDHSSEVFLYTDAAGGGRLSPLAAAGVSTVPGKLRRVDVGGAVVRRLVVRGPFLALTVRVVGALLQQCTLLLLPFPPSPEFPVDGLCA